VYLYFGGNGTLQLSYNFNDTKGSVSAFSPHGRALDIERNLDNGETYQRLVGEPVYFTVDLPGAFDHVTVTLRYQNPNQTVVELGVKKTKDVDLFDYIIQPLENKLVDNSDWSRLENDELILLQKEPVYSSIDDFIKNPPLDKKVGTYLAPPTPEFVDPDYMPNPATGSDINVPLRGKHEFYLYAAAGEDISVILSTTNLNVIPGEDPIIMTLFRNDAAVVTSENSSLQYLADTAGVYRLKVDTTDDIIITRLQSNQERLVVNNTALLAESATPVTINSDGNWLTMMAKHPAGVGIVPMYDRDFLLNRVDVPVTWNNPITRYHFTAVFPHGDVYLDSDSYLALPGATEFDPWFGFRPIARSNDGAKLDYVLSRKYSEPSRLRGWTTATASFDLTGVTQTRPNQLQFMLSAPGLDTVPIGLKVSSIDITAEQTPLTITYLWQKLFGGK